MVAGLVFFALLPFFANRYVIFIGNLALMYILLSVGLNMLLGYAGQLAFAHAALFGVGAYTTGLLKLEIDLHYGLALVAGVALATVTGLAVALPALRLRGLYLALATVAFAQATLWVFMHWNSVTYGGAGFRVPPLDFEPFTSRPDIGIYVLTYVIVLASIPLGWNLLRSRVGRAWVAIRESEVAAESLGIDITRYKTIAYVVSAMYAGTAGGLFAGMLGIVTPESFDLFQVIVHFCMVIVGGARLHLGGGPRRGRPRLPPGGAAGVPAPPGDRLRGPHPLHRARHPGGRRLRSSSATSRDGRSRFAARSTTSERDSGSGWRTAGRRAAGERASREHGRGTAPSDGEPRVSGLRAGTAESPRGGTESRG